MEEAPQPDTSSRQPFNSTLRVVLYSLGAFLLFLLALELMVGSLQHLSRNVVETVIQATSNPFTGLFIGLLITAILQSSSTTTALTVALVASGSLNLESAVPIIMGANVGTTITSTIVSLGFINSKKEFRRAVAAGTYHCFFNLLTVVVLFPLEYYYKFLSRLSSSIATYFVKPSGEDAVVVSHSTSIFDSVTQLLIDVIPYGFILILISFVLLFTSILLFRKIISELLKANSPESFGRFFFKNQLKSFGWGLVTTAAIRSSTITTSVVVPIVAKRIATHNQAAAFIMGANIGTTITAFIAAIMNVNTSSAISIAIAHFLFNFIGVLLFFPIPALRKLPLGLSSMLGKLTLQYRLAGLLFILVTFFFIPFSLIFFNQDSIRLTRLVYEERTGKERKYYHIKSRFNYRTQSGEWMKFNGRDVLANEVPLIIYPTSVKNNSLYIGKDLYLFNKPGFCWDAENSDGRYEACVEAILSDFNIANQQFDSVYVFKLTPVNQEDSLFQRIFLCADEKAVLRKEVLDAKDSVIRSEEVVAFEEK